MFQRFWSHITGRKDRLLRHWMLAFLAVWALLQFDLPGARAQRRMMGMGGGMMMRPTSSMMTPSMMTPSMNANGMGFSRAVRGFPGTGMGFPGTGMGFPGTGMGFRGTGMGFSGTGMGFSGAGMGFSGAMGSGGGGGMGYGGGGSGGYSGGGSQNGYGSGGSTVSPLPRNLDGYIDGSSTSSSYSTSGSKDGYADADSTSSGHALRGRLLGEFVLDGSADGDSTSSRHASRGKLLGEFVIDGNADGNSTGSRRGGADQAQQQRAADPDAREAAKRRAADDQNARAQAALAEESRQRAEREELEHSLHHPSAAEIRSGKALNDILADLQKRSDTGGSAALGSLALPLDYTDLTHINVSARAGTIGLLKNAGHVNWPTALSGSDFAAERERITRRTSEAMQTIKAKGVADGAVLDELQGDVYGLYRRLRNQGTDFPPSQYSEGLTFLRDFQSAIKGLWQLDVANHFNGKYALKANTAAELVKHMTEQGLHFTPAVSGDESAYAMLHAVLADYDRAVEGARR